MRVTAIRIRKLVSRQIGFGHDAAEIEAAVEEGDDLEEVARAVHDLVDGEIRHANEANSLRVTLDQMRNDVSYYQSNRDILKADVERYRTALRQYKDFVDKAQKAGIAPPESLQDDIPF